MISHPRAKHTKTQREMWWEAYRYVCPRNALLAFMEIPRWLNLCVQTQPWCSERLWLALARTWTSPAIGGDSVDISIQVYYCQLPGCLGISLFQGSSWRLCRHCSFQLSRDDSPLDVSHGPRHGQHLCYEGGSTLQTGLLATIISQDLKLYFSQVREIQQLAWLLWSFWWRLELLRELSMSYMGRWVLQSIHFQPE